MCGCSHVQLVMERLVYSSESELMSDEFSTVMSELASDKAVSGKMNLVHLGVIKTTDVPVREVTRRTHTESLLQRFQFEGLG